MINEVEIIIDDIFKQKADIMVCPAAEEAVIIKNEENIEPSIEAKIYEYGKVQLFEERRRNGRLPVSKAIMTDSYGLKEHFEKIIFAVPPMWIGRGDGREYINNNQNEGELYAKLLKDCYVNIFKLAAEYAPDGTVICPLLGTGTLCCPVEISFFYLKEAYREVAWKMNWNGKVKVAILNIYDLTPISHMEQLGIRYYDNNGNIDIEKILQDIRQYRNESPELTSYKIYEKYAKKAISKNDEMLRAYQSWLYLAEVRGIEIGEEIKSDAILDKDLEEKGMQVDLEGFLKSKLGVKDGISSLTQLGIEVGYDSTGTIYKEFKKMRETGKENYYLMKQIIELLKLDDSEQKLLYKLAGVKRA